MFVMSFVATMAEGELKKRIDGFGICKKVKSFEEEKEPYEDFLE